MDDTEILVEAHFQELLDELALLAGDQQADRTPNPQLDPEAPPEPLHVPSRGEELTSTRGETAAADAAAADEELEKFMPAAPRSLADTGLNESEVEAIILRLFLLRGTNTGLEISQQIALPFGITEKILHALKAQRLLVFKGPATLNDYAYETYRRGDSSGPALCRAVHLLQQRAGLAFRLHGRGRGAIVAKSTAAHAAPPPGLRRHDAQRGDVFPVGAGDHLGPRTVPVRPARQRQDQHRRTRSPPSSARASGFPAPSARGAKSSVSSIPPATRNCRWPPASSSWTKRNSTSAGSASAGRPSWWAAS